MVFHAKYSPFRVQNTANKVREDDQASIVSANVHFMIPSRSISVS